jgi:hypothetical protein
MSCCRVGWVDLHTRVGFVWWRCCSQLPVRKAMGIPRLIEPNDLVDSVSHCCARLFLVLGCAHICGVCLQVSCDCIQVDELSNMVFFGAIRNWFVRGRQHCRRAVVCLVGMRRRSAILSLLPRDMLVSVIGRMLWDSCNESAWAALSLSHTACVKSEQMSH